MSLGRSKTVHPRRKHSQRREGDAKRVTDTLDAMASEQTAISSSDKPVTVDSLVVDLRRLGIGEGDIVIVHSSLSALGWVSGGAQAVVEALLDTVGSAGTVVMPTQSGQLSDPAAWSDPPVPPAWVPVIRASLPAYDPYLTPTRSMGQVVECFRQHRQTFRSAHPTASFAANGAKAQAIIGSHPLTPSLGETSPLGRLYDLDAMVALLGVGHGRNTSLHLAEYRAVWAGKATYTEGVPVVVDGKRAWVRYDDVVPDDHDFEQIGAAFAETGHERSGSVGAGVGRACRLRTLVDFATHWICANRS